MKYALALLTCFIFITPVDAQHKYGPAKGVNPLVSLSTSMGTVVIELFADETPATVENFISLATGKKEFIDALTGKKVKRPYYNGITFHRVIDSFMIQGGCQTGTGTSTPGYFFQDEINGISLGLDSIKAHDSNGVPHSWLIIRTQEEYQKNILVPLYRKMGIASKEDFKNRQGEFIDRLKKMTLMEAYKNLGYSYTGGAKSHHLKRGVVAMANSGPNTNGSQFFITVADTPWLTGKHTVFGKVVRGMEVVDSISRVKVTARNRPVNPVTIISIKIND